MVEVVLVFLFIAMLVIPFFPAVLELYRKRDVEPLNINQDFSKDPAYFGKSFMNMVEKTLKTLKELEDGSKSSVYVTLSNKGPERVVLFENYVQAENYEDSVVVIKGGIGKINGEGNFQSKKEVLALGSLLVMAPTEARALLVRGSLRVEKPLKVFRWMHVGGDCIVNSQSNLGINLYCGKKLYIRAPCFFKRVFAEEIIIGAGQTEDNFNENSAYIKGTFKSKGSINIKTQDRRLVIEGNIISEQDIYIEGDVWVRGNVFSHGGVVFIRGCLIGDRGKLKSVVGKKRVELIGNVKVYGYIHTEGDGLIEP